MKHIHLQKIWGDVNRSMSMENLRKIGYTDVFALFGAISNELQNSEGFSLCEGTTEHETEKFIPDAVVLADDTEIIFSFGGTGKSWKE